MPGWFSWENQGAGVAVADLAGGSRGLVVMQIDNAPAVGTASGQNQGFFRIGDGLDDDGMVRKLGTGLARSAVVVFMENRLRKHFRCNA